MPNVLEYNQLQEILPHAYPFLLIDRVIDFKRGEYLIAEKLITGNEWALDDSAVDDTAAPMNCFPEVLLIEAAAQAALVIYHLSKVLPGEKIKYLLGKIKTVFFQPAAIGDVLSINAEATKMLQTGGYSNIKIKREKSEIAEVFITYKVLR